VGANVVIKGNWKMMLAMTMGGWLVQLVHREWVACRLEVLDLGGCCYETEDFNRICNKCTMAAVGPTVDESHSQQQYVMLSFRGPV
jgi:hypothetical protein